MTEEQKPQSGTAESATGVSYKDNAGNKDNKGDKTDAATRMAQGVTSAATQAAKHFPNAQTVNIYVTANAGTMRDAIGTQQREGCDAEPAVGRGNGEISALAMETWFAEASEREAALMAAAVFLPGAPFSTILDATHRLLAVLEAGRTDEKPREKLFTGSRTERLARLGASITQTNDPEDPGLKAEIVVFDPPERAAEARRHLWQESIDLRPALIRWLREMGEGHDPEIAANVGRGAGLAAACDFEGMFRAVVSPWLFGDAPYAHVAAGCLLALAADQHPERSHVLRLVHGWSREDSGHEELRAAAELCASAWGVMEADEALQVLKRLEETNEEHGFRWSQDAIGVFWRVASFYRAAHSPLATKVVDTLSGWLTDDRRSVFYLVPPIHLAIAGESELAALAAVDGKHTPLLLSQDEGDLVSRAARLLNIGLRRRDSREFVRGYLDQLAAYANKQTLGDGFAALINRMRCEGDDNDHARLDSFVDRWRHSHGATLAALLESTAG